MAHRHVRISSYEQDVTDSSGEISHSPISISVFPCLSSLSLSGSRGILSEVVRALEGVSWREELVLLLPMMELTWRRPTPSSRVIGFGKGVKWRCSGSGAQVIHTSHA